jgi:hypothetical protein
MWIALIFEFVIIVIVSILYVHLINHKNNNYNEDD